MISVGPGGVVFVSDGVGGEGRREEKREWRKAWLVASIGEMGR